MNLQQIKSDRRVKLLVDQVSEHQKIFFEEIKGPNWTSQTRGTKAVIGYSPTAYPAAALAHELLHFLIQQKGYRRLRKFFSTIDQTWKMKRLVDCLDNELQHHKMYPLFQNAGFPPEQFYADDDAQIADYLEKVLARNPTDLLELLPDFFTVIAPGGHLQHLQKQEFRTRFLNAHNGRFINQLTKIESAIVNWAASSSMNAEPTLRTIFLTLQNPCYTWFGYREKDMPPEEGFFIDQVFHVDETGGSSV